MDNLREKFKSFLDENIKKKDDIAVATTRLILAAIKDRDIEHRSKEKDNQINNNQILDILQNMVKQRKESVKIYSQAGRKELMERESREIQIIESFLPDQISAEEIKIIVEDLCSEEQAKSIKDLGKIIKILKERYPGRLDFKIVAEITKSILTK